LVYHQRSCISSRAGVHIITAGAYHQRSCIKTERKRNKAKPSFTFSAGKYFTHSARNEFHCPKGNFTRFGETNFIDF